MYGGGCIGGRTEGGHLLFLNNNNQALAVLLSAQDSLAVELIKGLLNVMTTFELNLGVVMLGTLIFL